MLACTLMLSNWTAGGKSTDVLIPHLLAGASHCALEITPGRREETGVTRRQ